MYIDGEMTVMMNLYSYCSYTCNVCICKFLYTARFFQSIIYLHSVSILPAPLTAQVLSVGYR